MTKYRLYGKDMKVKGTLNMFGGIQGIGIQSQTNNKLIEEFKEVVKNFLKDRDIKIVSQVMSKRKHCSYKPSITICRDFDIYYRYINPRTQRVELKKLKKVERK